MTYIVDDGGVGGDISAEILRLKNLARDLARIADGSGPTGAELACAPLLESYSGTLALRRCLTGTVSWHPVLTGPKIVTSELFVAFPRAGWVRTYSRFYRLGAPLPGREIVWR
jgi:hypothetical protein